MAERGRPSNAELQAIHAIRRPEPPETLANEAKVVWRTTVGRLPNDWFPDETLPMLEIYCTHVWLHRRLGMMLKPGTQKADVKQITAQMAEEAELIANLATKMRITQQSTHDRKKSKGRIKPAASLSGGEGHPLD